VEHCQDINVWLMRVPKRENIEKDAKIFEEIIL
jgi:hypothetical protein